MFTCKTSAHKPQEEPTLPEPLCASSIENTTNETNQSKAESGGSSEKVWWDHGYNNSNLDSASEAECAHLFESFTVAYSRKDVLPGCVVGHQRNLLH